MSNRNKFFKNTFSYLKCIKLKLNMCFLQAPDVRDALFCQFIDIRAVLKGRLPKELLRNIAIGKRNF